MSRAHRWFAFIESNTSGTGRLFVERARRLGLRPILFTSEPDRYPFAGLDELKLVPLDTSDLESLMLACRGLAADGGLAGVGSSSDYFIETAARIARACNLAGPDPQAIALCRNKLCQRERLRAAGTPQPKFQAIRHIEQVPLSISGQAWPIVVKPCFGSGSVGVKLCADQLSLTEHVRDVLARTHNERGIPVIPLCLLEEYVAGEEFSVEIFDGKAIVVTRKHLGPEPNFVEIGHDLPADVDRRSLEDIVDVAVDAVAVLGLAWGPAHVEVRVTVDGARVIEVNPRLAGGMIPELARLAMDIDLIEATIRRHAGEDVHIRSRANLHASIRFLLLGDNHSRLSDLREWPDIAEAVLYERGRFSSKVHGDFRDRIGHVIAVGDSSADAQRAVSRALSHVVGGCSDGG